MEISVELALVDAPLSAKQSIQQKLPAKFLVKDHSDRGWGLVIRYSQKLPSELNEAINVFLKPLIPLIDIVGNNDGVLRIGVFFSTACCTLRLNPCEQLTELKIPIEITTYPAFDAE